jgi:hypothetical protein
MAEHVVVGGSIAALTAADALLARGERVRVLLPERGIGGGFAPIHREGRVLELGVRLLELAYEGAAAAVPPLTEYRASLGAHRPYAPLIDRWIRGLLAGRVIEVPRPQMFFDGRAVEDLYFTSDALALRQALGAEELAAIAREAGSAQQALGAEAGLLDPSHSDLLGSLSANQASIQNHGQAFHDRFIAPIAEKIVAGGGEHVLATMRRKIWIPLFWPATLVQACGTGEVAFRPERPFHTVTPDGCGGLLEALLGRIESGGASIESAGRLEGVARTHGGEVELTLSSSETVRARRPVLGSAPAELFAAAGADYAPVSARSVICWLEVPVEQCAKAPSLLNIVDPELSAFRVSRGGRGAAGTQLLTVELRHDLPEEQIAEAATTALAHTGLVSAGVEAHVVMSAAAQTFPLPTRENTELFARARAALDDLQLDAEIVGGALDFGADALGEQIIQGLRAAEVLLA